MSINRLSLQLAVGCLFVVFLIWHSEFVLVRPTLLGTDSLISGKYTPITRANPVKYKRLRFRTH